MRKIVSLKQYFVLLYCISFLLTKGQSDSISKNNPPESAFFIQVQGHLGKLIKIHPSFPATNTTFITEVNIGLQTAGMRDWHQAYHYPQLALALLFADYGNKEVLGQSISLVPNLAFKKNLGKHIALQTRFGMGFSYFTKKYSRLENPTNLVIGSTVTNITFLSLFLSYKLNNHIYFNAGISSFHYSNGHYQLPNIGANIPAVSVGISYFPKERQTYYKRDSIIRPSQKMLLNAAVGYGRHEFGSATGPTGGPKYGVFQGSVYVSKRVRRIHNLLAGVCATYYKDYYDFITSEEMFENHQHLKAAVLTLFFGDEFIIGRFGLVAQVGINVYNPFLKEFAKWKHYDNKALLDTYNSNKVGIQYYFFNPQHTTHRNVFVGLYMKTKGAAADFPQVAIGCTF